MDLNNNNPLISVIVPIYNSEKYLERCITSICNQTYPNLEIILVNDGSKDHSLTICKTFAKKDKRIVIKDITNGGVSNARNTGLLIAKGEFIQFLDSDDFIDKNYIKSLYDIIKVNDIGMALCAIKSFDIYSKLIDEWTIEDSILNFDNIDQILFLDLINSFLLFGPVNKLYKKDIITKNSIKFDKSLSYGEDLLFNLEYFKHISKISITNKIAYNYVHDNPNSLSKKLYEDKIQIACRIHFALLDFFKRLSLVDEKSLAVLYNRLFDDYYNQVFAIANNPKFSNKTKKYKILELLKDQELKKCYYYLQKGKYAKWIVYLMKHKAAFTLLLMIKTNNLLNKKNNE